ncbi:MAG TPA: hypothetical protein VFA75_00410 [Nevskia sp.]|nr:hypothetical protein [Nevskia sp.]
MSDALIAWAVDAATGTPRHVSEVRTGLACGCLCPGCKTRLEAVNAENPNARRRPYFRHHELPETGGCADLAAAAAIRGVLSTPGFHRLAVPAHLVTTQARDARGGLHYGKASLPDAEWEVEAVSFLDDALALLTLADGSQVYVILRAASQNMPSAPETPPGAGILLLDLDGRQLANADPQVLRERLQLLPSGKRWIRHPREAQLLARAAAGAAEAARRADAAADRQRLEPTPPSAGPKPPAPILSPAPVRLAWSAAIDTNRLAGAVRRYEMIWPGPHWQDLGGAALEARAAGADPSRTYVQLADDYSARAGVVRDFLSTAGLTYLMAASA